MDNIKLHVRRAKWPIFSQSLLLLGSKALRSRIFLFNLFPPPPGWDASLSQGYTPGRRETLRSLAPRWTQPMVWTTVARSRLKEAAKLDVDLNAKKVTSLHTSQDFRNQWCWLYGSTTWPERVPTSTWPPLFFTLSQSSIIPGGLGVLRGCSS